MKPNRSIAFPWAQPIEPPMSHETTVARRQVEITNRLGLHLRAADQFVGLARQSGTESARSAVDTTATTRT